MYEWTSFIDYNNAHIVFMFKQHKFLCVWYNKSLTLLHGS